VRTVGHEARAQRAEAGMGFLGRERPARGVWGSAASFPSGVRARPRTKTILAHFQTCRRHLLEVIFVKRTVFV